MSGTFNVSKFRSVMSSRGTLKNNKFRVEIPTPQAMRSSLGNNINRDMDLYCDAGVLPMVDMTTIDIRRWGYGPTEKRAYGTNFGDVPLRFISDGEGLVWNFFQEWQNIIVNFDSSQGPLGQDRMGKYAHEVAYKQDYAVDINVYVYDDRGAEMLKVTLLEAYPTRLDQVQLAWDDNNNVMRVFGMFTYRDWYAEKAQTIEGFISNAVNSELHKLLGNILNNF